MADIKKKEIISIKITPAHEGAGAFYYFSEVSISSQPTSVGLNDFVLW